MKKKDFLAVCQIILKQLEERLPNEFELEKDYYWDIDETDFHNPYKEILDLSIGLGQHSDDWEGLYKILQNPDRAISFDLLRLAAMFRGIKQLGEW